MDKQLYIIAGANGSGKTTLAQVLLKEKNLEFLNADEIAKEIAPDNMEKVPISAGKEYIKRRTEFFKTGKSFAVETTLSGKNIDNLIKQAKELDYKITILYIFLNKFTTCIQRVEKRVKNGGHHVPEIDITRRYFRSVVNFWDKYKSQIDGWMLFYNGEDYNPVNVADGNSKSCDIMNKEMFENFLQIVQNAKDVLKNAQQ